MSTLPGGRSIPHWAIRRHLPPQPSLSRASTAIVQSPTGDDRWRCGLQKGLGPARPGPKSPTRTEVFRAPMGMIEDTRSSRVARSSPGAGVFVARSPCRGRTSSRMSGAAFIRRRSRHLRRMVLLSGTGGRVGLAPSGPRLSTMSVIRGIRRSETAAVRQVAAGLHQSNRPSSTQRGGPLMPAR